jgi:uncharacterized damage-inducible protein DinB
MLDTQTLSQLVFDAFTRQITWREASSRYPVTEYIESFRNLRAGFQRLLEDLTDAQVAYTELTNPMWSLSETVTHLIYSQNFYHNQLLEITSSELPHLAEAARGFGEGAQQNVPAAQLRAMLSAATQQIEGVIAATLPHSTPEQVTRHPFFGEVTYATWIFLLMAHELDHYRQSVVMRRLARAAHPS